MYEVPNYWYGMVMITLLWLLWAEMRVCDHKGNGYKIFVYIL